MIIKEIEISGVKVAFKSSAAVPRLYRARFQRDVFKDFAKLEKAFKNKTEDGENIPIEDLELFENLAYIMALAADSTVPTDIDEWLDQFDMFSIYEVLPEIIELWGTNMQTDVTVKKNKIPAPAK